MVDLAPGTGFSFLNLDDRTVQLEITAGAINLRVWSLNRDSDFEIDTPNQAFTVTQPGRYKIETSENGDYTVVTIWQGAGESTGNGQTYTLHAGQRTTFSGTTSLNAETEQIGNPDDFDRWSEDRERRYDDSPSARYCSRDVVGFEDLDQYGQWQPYPEYGNVWFPQVGPGWAPYHEGHWAWIDPWGWTWVDDDPWGYAPFHYGRWAFISGRWGWVPGPRAVYPVYAPALVVFVGGGGMAYGSNVAWFPLGPREVYVPSYRVSRGYVNRVNVTNTTVNTTVINNVYNTTIVNNRTTINNVTYVNRNVRGAVTAVPQRAFATAQPVARNAVQVNPNQIARQPVSVRAAVPPQQQAVYGVHANTANHVPAPPAAIARREVIAKNAPPPPRPTFAAREPMLAKNPGVPLARPELRKLAPAARAVPVRTAPPGRPATPTPAPARAGQPVRPGTPPANAPAANERPGMNPAQPNRPGGPPTNRPEMNQPNRPSMNPPNPREPNQPGQPPVRNDRPPSPQPNYRPEPNQPAPNNRPEPNRPTMNQPAPSPTPNRAEQPATRNNRPPSTQPNHRPDNNRPNNRPEPNRPEMNRPPNRSEPTRPQEAPRNQPAPRPENRPPGERQQPDRPNARQEPQRTAPRSQAPGETRQPDHHDENRPQ